MTIPERENYSISEIWIRYQDFVDSGDLHYNLKNSDFNTEEMILLIELLTIQNRED